MTTSRLQVEEAYHARQDRMRVRLARCGAAVVLMASVWFVLAGVQTHGSLALHSSTTSSAASVVAASSAGPHGHAVIELVEGAGGALRQLATFELPGDVNRLSARYELNARTEDRHARDEAERRT